MKIGVIGNGIVGNATGKSLEPHTDEVRYYDRDYSKCDEKATSAPSLVEWADLTFVCLPTPQCVNSLACDTSEVEGFFLLLTKLRPKLASANLVLRSTVPVGFTRRMRERYGLTNLVHSPEFLTARTALEDAKNPTRLLIGDPSPSTDEYWSDCVLALHELYGKVWPSKNVGIYRMTSDESEFVKLMQNSFSAVKVSFFNEMRAFSDKQGLDWDRCLSALLAGGWINPMHTQVPGPDGKRGFGGTCLPKDTASLCHQIMQNDLYAWVLNSALMRNEVDRK